MIKKLPAGMYADAVRFLAMTSLIVFDGFFFLCVYQASTKQSSVRFLLNQHHSIRLLSLWSGMQTTGITNKICNASCVCLQVERR